MECRHHDPESYYLLADAIMGQPRCMGCGRRIVPILPLAVALGYRDLPLWRWPQEFIQRVAVKNYGEVARKIRSEISRLHMPPEHVIRKMELNLVIETEEMLARAASECHLSTCPCARCQRNRA